MNSQQKNTNKVNRIISLTEFSIELLSGHQSDVIYANGNMQVGVLINIQAMDENLHIIQLSDDQLDKIELINYVTGNTLDLEWSYSSTKNDYDNTFPHPTPENTQKSPSQYKKTTVNKLDNNSEYQRKIYWVTTTKYEAIMIAAQVLLDEKIFSTNQGSQDSCACVTGYPRIIYHSDDLEHPDPVLERSGQYVVHIDKKYSISPPEHYDKNYDWQQNNYYLTLINKPTGFSVKHVDIEDTYNDYDFNIANYHGIVHRVESDNLYFWFLWGTMKKDKTVGDEHLTVRKTSVPNVETTYTSIAQADILTATRTDSVCLSRLYFESPVEKFWVELPDALAHFRFYDNYGNQSYQIEFIMEGAKSFHLQDMQP
ncbi:hypothetical protein [Xenorhabdus sp. KJ12.1]|uniref:hypothetical protein n=1 Tax=Xenorhabdus sp. KJ12.1 TaxID=1851571 RepID=UPI000C04B010|nr:hypothetical protein [Xenorhabdus sp. KJ12.1]PHM68886.1 hypothetical protein Xekj_02961 [Xenorhabdus sp. KJ12.1]